MVTAFNDPLNLRDYTALVVDFIKKWGGAELSPRSTLSFLITLFSGKDYSFLFKENSASTKSAEKSVKDLAETIRRLFTGNVHFSRMESLSVQIVSGEYDLLFLKNLETICTAIDSTSRSDAFYSHLLQLVSRRFFTESEERDIRVFYEEGMFSYLHLVIIKHAFASLYNIPYFYADRLYEDAQTYDYDSPLRFSLMRISADCGNKNAALAYGNYLAKSTTPTNQNLPVDIADWMEKEIKTMDACPLRTKICNLLSERSNAHIFLENDTKRSQARRRPDYDEAFRYLLIAFPLPAAIWSAAYLIEQGYLGREQESLLKATLKVHEKIEKLKEFDGVRDELATVVYTDDDPEKAETLLFVYSVYFFLAYSGFSKGFNSMAKLLHLGKISVYSAEYPFTTESLREKYWINAIKGGNPTAILNCGDKQLREIEASGTFDSHAGKEVFTEELLTVASNLKFMKGNYYLGCFYQYAAQIRSQPLKSQADLLEIYKTAEELDQSGDGVEGDLFYRIASLTNDPNERKSEYQKALQAGKTEASYHLALSLFNEYKVHKKIELLLNAQEYLKNYIFFLDQGVRPSATFLLERIDEELKEIQSEKK